MTAKALKLLWDAKILLVQERAASSDVVQVLDVTCFKPVQDACIRELEAYKVRFGNEPIAPWEFPALYSVAVDKALTRKNLKTGFAKVGLFPLMSGDAWLGKYRLTCEIHFSTHDFSARYIQQKKLERKTCGIGC